MIMPQGVWSRLVPEKDLVAADPVLRAAELELRRRLYRHAHLPDDTIISDVLYVPVAYTSTGTGMAPHPIRPEQLEGASRFEPVIVRESDIDGIGVPRVSVDEQETARRESRLGEVFGGILSVERRGEWMPGEALMDHFAVLRGLENLYADLLERPKWVHEAMERMCRARLAYLDQVEELGLLTLNNNHLRVGTGGLGVTDELPAPDYVPPFVRSRDMWGRGSCQVFASVSPDMHAEFALQYENRVLERFGLNCYGCCEPLHHKIGILRSVPHLRRVSMSPWVDVEKGAAELGRDYIFSYKPNPAVLATSGWSPAQVENNLREVVRKARGCVLEIIMKDIETCTGCPERLTEWGTIARRVADEAGHA